MELVAVLLFVMEIVPGGAAGEEGGLAETCGDAEGEGVAVVIFPTGVVRGVPTGMALGMAAIDGRGGGLIGVPTGMAGSIAGSLTGMARATAGSSAPWEFVS